MGGECHSPQRSQGRRRRRRPLDDRPARLVAAGTRPRERDGQRGVHVAQVAARAGLSLKSFYRCFRGKDDLLIALLAEESAVGAVLLASSIGGPSGDDPLRRSWRSSSPWPLLPASRRLRGRSGTRTPAAHRAQPVEIGPRSRPLTDVIAVHRDGRAFARRADGVRRADRRLPRSRVRTASPTSADAEYLYGSAAADGRGLVTAIAAPRSEPATRHYTIISVDDHLIEPADLFEGRMPAASPIARRASSRSTTDARRGCTKTGSTAGRAERGRRPAEGRSGTWSRPASTRCKRIHFFS